MKAPERVFLLDVTEKGGALQNWNVSVTEEWREHGKVEYIRADLVAAKDAEIEKLREAVHMVLIQPRAEDDGWKSGEMYTIQIEASEIQQLRAALTTEGEKGEMRNA